MSNQIVCFIHCIAINFNIAENSQIILSNCGLLPYLAHIGMIKML